MHIPVTLRALATAALFTPWDKSQWIASDDTVRNGTSHSALDIIEPGSAGNPFLETIANFHGKLDYATLGGAGFASQRTVDDWPGLDISAYDTITLEIPYADGKRYSFNLKDTVPPPINGVEQSGVSWEFNFQLPAVNHTDGQTEKVVIPISEFVPTFRGRVQNNTAPLDLTSIKRVNIMIRSFFAEQDGDFELHIKSVVASKEGSQELRST
ncbi:CIA30 family protein [Colletotrichum tofieldiae]|uniref:CIA30 family protein n=1 Tax=Colletotrichum tofieldiae TaxID=708197 RepID=A0A161VPP5_9PEZI|nr:CIA30 family protein [Colletotrichum tofieldiae]GKT63339.1 CIA30 family protein [Colletotrichum tofieldiae]GKT72650.1 CIA30 family protein [Colletotrichum tofieldiae]GKT89512.1 CIA30 family protein [Colletotrichum tofieldiae]